MNDLLLNADEGFGKAYVCLLLLPVVDGIAMFATVPAVVILRHGMRISANSFQE